jgi:hypothetical protein
MQHLCTCLPSAARFLGIKQMSADCRKIEMCARHQHQSGAFAKH